MKKTLILVIEDDPAIQQLISTTLHLHDYQVHVVVNGQQALLEISSHNPDIIILDLGLPDMDGLDIIQTIRKWSVIPIIVVSARSMDREKIVALDAGADDYLTKPFSVEELLARIRVAIRRLHIHKTAGLEQNLTFQNGELLIQYDAGIAYLSGIELKLTPIEFKLLVLLAKNVGKVLTHNTITKEIWGVQWENNIATLRVFMTNLRKKLEHNGQTGDYIQTHVGVGYRMQKKD